MDQQNLEWIAEAFEEEIQRRCASALGNPDGSVRPIRVWFPNGWASGTIHKVAVVNGVDIWATALHVLGGGELDVPEAMTIAGQLADYGKCYVLDRKTDPDRPDVHFFTQDREALDIFKARCPSPTEAAAAFGLRDGFYMPDPSDEIVGNVSGYPHGVVHGEPQVRHLAPFYTQDVAELLWFHVEEPVVGGMSGGAVLRWFRTPEQSSGVIVAQSGRARKFYCLVQLFHNEMRIVDG